MQVVARRSRRTGRAATPRPHARPRFRATRASRASSRLRAQSVAAADARSEQRTLNRRPGYCGVSTGVAKCQPRRFRPAHDVEADRIDDAPIASRAHPQQRFVELGELRCDPVRRRARVVGRPSRRNALSRSNARSRPLHSALHSGMCALNASALGGPDRTRIAPDDGALERLQRRDLAHAYVATSALPSVRGRDRSDAEQYREQHRYDGDARRNREVEQRRRPRIRHPRPPAGSR